MGYRLTRQALLVTMAALGGCAAPDEIGTQSEDSTATTFDRELVLPDEALEDPNALSVSEVQAFLDQTPHGNTSVLADHVSHGRTAAQAIVDAATSYGISPLILLTRLQLEQSLIGKSSASANRLSWAMGCGCPDGGGCNSAYKGFDRQVECAAERFSTYLQEIRQDGTTIAGWGIGKASSTLDGYTVRPRNAHTAAMYTYTPWVKSAKQFLGLYRKYADHLGYAAPAPAGCAAVTYPSGATVQLRPDPDLAELAGQPDAPCFLDTEVMVDHETFEAFGSSSKLASNFAAYEFADASSSARLRLSPELVSGLQATRDALGSSIALEHSWLLPDELETLCDDPSDPICADGEMTRGTAAIASATAGPQALLQAATEAGLPSCRVVPSGVFLGVGEPALGCPAP